MRGLDRMSNNDLAYIIKNKWLRAEVDDEEEYEEPGVSTKTGAGAGAGNETFVIDNLPNDDFEIPRMLKEVKKHIKALEICKASESLH